jgi:hypothetical protein
MDAQYIDNFTKSTNANLAKALRNFAQSASNTVAENVSVPVDAIAWALRKTGIPVNKPVLGSDWMREKGLTKDVEQGGAQLAGETVGMLSPLGFTKQGAQALIEGAGKLKNMPVGNMFIGQTANTWDEVAAAQAKMMEGQGKSAQEIWKETGTFKGPDGKYRQEIADDLATLNPIKQKAIDWMSEPGPSSYPGGKVSDLLAHTNLNNAYPEVLNIRSSLKKGEGASYYPNDGFGELIESPVIFQAGQLKDPSWTKSQTLHELQHAIQKREGWAAGAGSDEKNYRKFAGEAEARATQARMNMTPEQRRAVFPYESYDVPVNKLIVK